MSDKTSSDAAADVGAAGGGGGEDEHIVRARGLLERLLSLMGVSARLSVRPQTAPDFVAPPAAPIIDITGEDLGLLIGWRGETLRAIQTVLNLMMGGEPGDERRVILDVERYRARREEQVRDLALRTAERVKRTGQRHTLDPMHGYERRAIHMALHQEPGVRTESVGREPARRVVIHPTSEGQVVRPPGGEGPVSR